MHEATSTPKDPEIPKPFADAASGAFMGSPLKKQRASLSASDENSLRRRSASASLSKVLELGGPDDVAHDTSGGFGGELKPEGEPRPESPKIKKEEHDEEL